MGAVTYPTLEHVAQEARPYPTHLLEGCETGLCFFSAAFMGHNDAVHFAEAGLRIVWCIDTDRSRLRQMEAVYPEGWYFIEEDAWAYARQAQADVTNLGWDVISVDPWTADFQRCADSVELWCSIAKRAVTLGSGVRTKVEAPDGWKISEVMERSSFRGGVNWTVLVPDA